MGTIPSSPGTGTELPKELATLQELVSQLSKKAMEEDSGAQELREAVGSLAENLTRQISAVALSAKPHATSQLANIPGRSFLDYVSSPAPNGSEPDSEGQGDEELVEPMFPRSEVSQSAFHFGFSAVRWLQPNPECCHVTAHSSYGPSTERHAREHRGVSR